MQLKTKAQRQDLILKVVSAFMLATILGSLVLIVGLKPFLIGALVFSVVSVFVSAIAIAVFNWVERGTK